MSAPSATESLRDLVKCPIVDFKFTHLLLNHRVQWFMMHCMLQRLQSKDVANLNEMWGMYRSLFDIHSSVEEEKMLVALQSPEAKGVTEKVHSEHESLSTLLKEVEEAKGKGNEQFEEKLKAFASKYHQHTLMEERELLPICQSLDTAKRTTMTGAIRDYFKAQPDSVWLILSMRDITATTGDTALWEQSMPWFFRNVVATFLGFNATYKKYTNLFPPSKGWLAAYGASVATN